MIPIKLHVIMFSFGSFLRSILKCNTYSTMTVEKKKSNKLTTHDVTARYSYGVISKKVKYLRFSSVALRL